MKIVAEFSPQGDYMALRYFGRKVKNAKHERGVVKAFSFRSRSRLMKKISQLNRDVIPVFVTLTYPSVFPENFEEYKYHVHKFLIYLFRKFPSAGVIWKMEFQQRGAAHFHLLIFNVAVGELSLFVPECWFRIAGNADPDHLRWHLGLLGNGNKHCVQEIRSWHGVKSYASKYFVKMDESTDKTGRFWGVRGQVPFSKLLQFTIDIKTALLFRRAVSRKTGMAFKLFGFWAYGFHTDWLRFIYHYENSLDDPVPESPPKWLELDPSRDPSRTVHTFYL